MNRRGFLNSILRAGVSAAILPPATTYLRSAWRRERDSRLFVRTFFFNEGLASHESIMAQLAKLDPITAIQCPVYTKWMEMVLESSPNYGDIA